MKAVVLAAGYATRLRPLTESRAKELLPVGGRPIVDWILDAVKAVDSVDEVHLVTNHRKLGAFSEWARDRGVHLHDDGTTTNDDRLGAIGDLRFVVEGAGLDDDLLVIAGDNLFEFSLVEYERFWRTHGVASAVAVRDVGSLELAKHYGIVSVDPAGRLVDFVEKPTEPDSTLVATATYLFHRSHVELLDTYLSTGHSPDQPGRFVEWLCRREPVYAWRFEGAWYDIGDADQLLVADNRLRAERGLPLRAAYSPD